MSSVKLWVAICGGALLGLSGTGFGHSTGHEMRQVAQCEKLPMSERTACRSCLTRALKHHYHLDYPSGVRCRLDNGKP